jgi:leader peptidase (prepilin peptidase) / N-methyltransferase
MDPQIPLLLIIALLGAMLGSFLNVCIYRLPRGESVVTPRSHCPGCGAMIRWYDNLPLASWLVLRGRCRDCGAPISVRYPLIEVACALLAVAAFLKAGLTWESLESFLLLYLLLGIAVTDSASYLIPDSFSLGGLAAGLALSFLPGGITPLQSLIGVLAGGGVLYLAAWLGELILRREAMGGGDIKMLGMIGAFLGWPGVLFTLFVGSLAGTLVYGWINYVRGKSRLVPFGVFLALGAGLYVFFGRQLISWYWSLFRV